VAGWWRYWRHNDLVILQWMRGQGIPSYRIARRLGKSLSTVTRMVVRLGLPMRDTLGAVVSCRRCRTPLFDDNRARGRGAGLICRRCSSLSRGERLERLRRDGPVPPKRRVAIIRGTHLTAAKVSRERLRLETLGHYSDGPVACRRCGFSDVRALLLDHIDGGGNKDRMAKGRTGYGFWVWLKRNGWPAGFQVLCWNCSWLKQLDNGEFGNGARWGEKRDAGKIVEAIRA
jgi:hypothetical protein